MKNENLQNKLVEKRRLATLLFLADEPDLSLPFNLLRLALESYLKHVTVDDLNQDADFLRAAGLVTLKHEDKSPVLCLTTSGREVAKGSRKINGIQPLPLD